MSAWLVCPSVQSPSGSIRWRQTLWCRRRVTVVSGRRGPKTWYHKPPTPHRDAGTPVARHCHHDNYPHASLDACCRHRACGLWMHHGNAAGRGDGAVGRAPPAEGSWSRSDLRKRSKCVKPVDGAFTKFIHEFKNNWEWGQSGFKLLSIFFHYVLHSWWLSVSRCCSVIDLSWFQIFVFERFQENSVF